MRKPVLAIALIILIISAQIILSAPTTRKPMRIQLNTDYVRAMGAYRRLESRLSRDDLRVLTTIGILNGAHQAEKQMERNLVAIVKELLQEAQALNDDELIDKVKNIEKQLARDHRALLILTSAMDLVTGAKDVSDFKADMQQTLQQIRRQSDGGEVVDISSSEAGDQPIRGAEETNEVAERIAALRRQILQQVRAMKELVEEKVTHTLDYLIAEADEGSLLAKASKKVLRKRNASEVPEVPANIKPILNEEDFRNNLVDAQLEVKNNDIIDDSLEDDFLKPLESSKSKIVIANSSSNNNKNSSTLKSSSLTQAANTTTTAATTTVTTATASRTTRAAAGATSGATSTSTVITPTTISQNVNTTNTDAAKLSKQLPGVFLEPIPIPIEQLQVEDDDFPDIPPPPDAAGGGGLVGIISSLSGGEGGSDIGALIGALTGVISTLFGPGGLDIESLISTATSLISGLLAGNKNFGTVLGTYIGTAFDGLSGGGGAVNNGQFIGNLLGTVYAQLSADPEDDDLRPNPLLFARNLISSFVEAKNRKESDEDGDDERRSDSHKGGTGGGGGGGSDSGGFIKHIASHIVGSLVSLILNASLGASGGASHASASLFGSSSHKSGHGGGGGGGGGGQNGHKY